RKCRRLTLTSHPRCRIRWQGTEVKSGHFDMSDQCPLYPQKRTLVEPLGMSALCQKRTFFKQDATLDLSTVVASVDQGSGNREQRIRNGEAERLSGREIND